MISLEARRGFNRSLCFWVTRLLMCPRCSAVAFEPHSVLIMEFSDKTTEHSACRTASLWA